eukprot:5018551-Prymnesium_polylepis.1
MAAETRLIQFAHEQRLLLLRCLHQMLSIVYQDASAPNYHGPLHNIVCGSVALLLQGDLPSRLLQLLLDEGYAVPLEARLPARLRGPAPSAAGLRPGTRMEVQSGGGWALGT